jgi:hypothetical protein
MSRKKYKTGKDSAAPGSKMAELLKLKAEYDERISKEGQEILGGLFKEFFDAFPKAKAVVWTQYTPYFNDGGACTFRVNKFELKLNEAIDGVTEADADLENESYLSNSYSYGDGCAGNVLSNMGSTKKENSWYKGPRRALTDDEKAMCVAFKSLQSNCDQVDDLLSQVLGDHVQVCANRDGFDVTDYEHD